MPTPHLPRLGHALRALLHERRHAALGTLDAAGAPFVSMVPFAVDATAGRLVLHISGLAAHTGHMAAEPRVSLLVTAADVDGQAVHDLARAAYLARFPEATPMTELPDFRFITLRITGARQVAGFGAAHSVPADELASILAA